MEPKKLKKQRVNSGQSYKKTIILVISGVIIVSLLVGGSFLIYRNNSNQTGNSPNDKPSQEEKKPIPPKDNPPPDQPDEEEGNCPYLNETMIKLPSGKYGDGKAYLTEFKKIPRDFVIKCWKKGYHWLDILQLWKWKILETDIPDLKAEKRVGVIRELAVMPDFEKLARGELDFSNPGGTPYKGVSRNLVVIVQKISNSGAKINLDENIQESPMDFDNYDKNTTRDYIQELVNFALSQEENINSQQHKISLLWSLGIENFQKEEEIGWGETSGSSAGSAIYLALLSTLHKLPISNKVCATGTIKMNEEKVKNLATGQEVILKKGDNLPIGGLKAKATGAVEAGLNQLILSKYHSAPNILTKPSKKDPTKSVTSDDYNLVVPAETKAKMNVHWTENIQELKKLILGGGLS